MALQGEPGGHLRVPILRPAVARSGGELPPTDRAAWPSAQEGTLRPLYGSIDIEQCRHRTSEASRKVTLTLAKRHKNRTWPALQKSR